MAKITACVNCGADVVHGRGRPRSKCADCYIPRPNGSKPTHPCSACGELMWQDTRYPVDAQPPGRVCRSCRRSRNNGPRPSDSVQIEPHTCESCGDVWTPQRRRLNRVCPKCRKRSARRWISCEFCGERGFVTTLASGRFCSQQCAQRHNAGWSTSTSLVHVPRIPRSFTPEHCTSGRLFVAGCCRRCGDQFTILDQLEISYCSRRCRWSDAKERRRALKRDAFVENVNRRHVFERDGWRCQLCRRMVDRSKSVPHPKAPTLDHIIPLAQGGTHEPKNVQLACFLCNSIKGDRLANDQLRLFG